MHLAVRQPQAQGCFAYAAPNLHLEPIKWSTVLHHSHASSAVSWLASYDSHAERQPAACQTSRSRRHKKKKRRHRKEQAEEKAPAKDGQASRPCPLTAAGWCMPRIICACECNNVSKLCR